MGLRLPDGHCSSEGLRGHHGQGHGDARRSGAGGPHDPAAVKQREREGPRAVEIGKGSTTGTFPVVTDAVGLRPGEERALTIAAFYAEPTEAQMVLVGPER